jgi:hypothetical protein
MSIFSIIYSQSISFVITNCVVRIHVICPGVKRLHATGATASVPDIEDIRNTHIN